MSKSSNKIKGIRFDSVLGKMEEIDTLDPSPEYITRTTQFIVAPQGHNTFSDHATTITITDDAGGEFVVVEQNSDRYSNVAINPEEWPALRSAIDKLVGECR